MRGGPQLTGKRRGFLLRIETHVQPADVPVDLVVEKIFRQAKRERRQPHQIRRQHRHSQIISGVQFFHGSRLLRPPIGRNQAARGVTAEIGVVGDVDFRDLE